MKTLRESLNVTTKLLIVNAYAGDDGGIAWTSLKSAAMTANTRLDMAAGAAAAAAHGWCLICLSLTHEGSHFYLELFYLYG